MQGHVGVDLQAQVTTAELTPWEAPHDMNVQRMHLHEWVADQQKFQYSVGALSLDMAPETWTYSWYKATSWSDSTFWSDHSHGIHAPADSFGQLLFWEENDHNMNLSSTAKGLALPVAEGAIDEGAVDELPRPIANPLYVGALWG